MWSQERDYNVVYIGEAPESDEDIRANLTSSQTPPSPSPSDEDISRFKNSLKSKEKYTLLHRKLLEKNEKLKEELINVACQPYINGSKDIQSLTHHLIGSQKVIQGISSSLKKLSKDFINLEATIDSLQLNCQTLPFASTSSNFSNKL